MLKEWLSCQEIFNWFDVSEVNALEVEDTTTVRGELSELSEWLSDLGSVVERRVGFSQSTRSASLYVRTCVKNKTSAFKIGHWSLVYIWILIKFVLRFVGANVKSKGGNVLVV